MTADKPIISHCIEHAKSRQSVCNDCNKAIPHMSLRVAEIYRKNKKVKKDLAKHTWYHFNCWKVPEYLTRVPIDQFRGYPTLNDKDKARVQRVISSGVGATWKDLMEKEQAKKTEKELEEEQEKKEKKEKKKKEDEKALEMNLADKLTGVQEKPNKTNKKSKTNKDKQSKTINKDKQSKIIKKDKKPKLPKRDLAELEKIASEFNAFK